MTAPTASMPCLSFRCRSLGPNKKAASFRQRQGDFKSWTCERFARRVKPVNQVRSNGGPVTGPRLLLRLGGGGCGDFDLRPRAGASSLLLGSLMLR